MEAENERMRILELLDKGKINGAEAGKLLEELQPSQTSPVEQPGFVPGGKPKKAHWMQIRITQLSTGKRKFSMTLPIFFIRFGISFAKKQVETDEDRAAMQVGREFFRDPVKGKFVDTTDPEDDERVEITFL